MRKGSSIQRKMMQVVLITISVVLLLTCAAFFAYEFFSYKQDMERNISALGKVIASNSTAALAFDNSEDAIEILSALRAEKHIVTANLYDDGGQLFSRWLPEGASATEFNPVTPGNDGYFYSKSHLHIFEPVTEQGKRVGTLYIVSNLESLDAKLLRYTIIALIVVLISFLVGYLLQTKLQNRITTPINNLAATAAQVSRNSDYTVRAPNVDDNDEIGQLTVAFNKMLSRIESQNQEIMMFNHELEMKVEMRTKELESSNNELLLKNEFIEAIIDSSVDVIAVVDVQLRYVMLNKKALEIYGKSEEEFIGNKIFEVFPAVKGSELHIRLLEALQGNPGHSPQYQSMVTNRVFENFFIPLKDNSDSVYSVLLIGHDITESIEAREKLHDLNIELANSNKQLEQFAYITSHDLQEPLRKILTFSDLALSNLSDPEKSKDYLGKVMSAGLRMSSLIRNILDYSRISGNTHEPEYIDMNDVIQSIKGDVELIIQEKNATISHGVLPPVKGNSSQICQLFLNLVNNALKFSDKRPVVQVSGKAANLEELRKLNFEGPDQSYVEITVTDNGIGFDQKFADKIFGPFQRLHSRKEYPGTGIGLAICKKIIENHNGHIVVTSQPGIGTTFRIFLPADENVEKKLESFQMN